MTDESVYTTESNRFGEGSVTYIRDWLLAKELGIEEPDEPDYDDPTDYTHPCGAFTHEICGHLNCMSFDELLTTPELYHLKPDELRQFWAWMQHQGHIGHIFFPADAQTALHEWQPDNRQGELHQDQ